jgi:hypothetical protein
MSVFLRKSFGSGPLRLNLSKSGLGLSGGITGARVGIGPKGAYVHGGRKGVYYRKFAPKTPNRKSSASAASEHTFFVDTGLTYKNAKPKAEPKIHQLPELPEAGLGIIMLFVTGFLFFIMGLIFSSATVLILGLLSAIVAIAYISLNTSRKAKAKKLYKQLYHDIENEVEPEKLIIERKKAGLTANYCFWLDYNFFKLIHTKFYENPDYISPVELQEIEAEIKLPENIRKIIKREGFSNFLEEVLKDHVISPDEEEKLNELQNTLNLKDSDIPNEKSLIECMCNMREALIKPLKPQNIDLRLKENENCYYKSEGRLVKEKVMNRFQRNRIKYKEVGYDVDMEGQILITDSRILIAGSGSRSYDLKRIMDITLSVEDHTVHLMIDGRKSPLIFALPKAGTFTGTLKNILGEEA